MHTFSLKRGAVRAVLFASRRALLVGLGLGLAASLAVAVAGQGRGQPQAPQQTAQPGFGEPVHIYPPNNPYGPPREDGEIHPEHVRGQVWVLTGEPGGANVVVQVGDQGVLIVDTGTKEMAPKLLAEIQRLAQESGGEHKEIRKIINTNGRMEHVGGNEVIAKAGSQIISGEERAQQLAFVAPSAEVVAHENVLRRLSASDELRPLAPTDAETFEVDNQRFNGEAVQIHYPSNAANTDGQLVVLFRGSDVIVAGDVVDMRTYPVIDVKAGGTIDGLLVAINKVIDMAAPGPQAEGGTVIIPGHGRSVDQSEVALYRNMLTIIRNTIQYYKNQGKTLQQVLDLKPGEGYDQRWGGGAGGSWTTRDFITAVYETLPAKGPVFFSMKTTTTAASGKAF